MAFKLIQLSLILFLRIPINTRLLNKIHSIIMQYLYIQNNLLPHDQ